MRTRREEVCGVASEAGKGPVSQVKEVFQRMELLIESSAAEN